MAIEVPIDLDFFDAIPAADEFAGLRFSARVVPLDSGRWLAVLDGEHGGVLCSTNISPRDALRDVLKAVLKRVPNREALGIKPIDKPDRKAVGV